MNFDEAVQTAVSSISPAIVNAYVDGGVRPDLLALDKAPTDSVVYIDPPSDLSADELVSIGKLTNAPYVVSAPNREHIRKSMVGLGLHVQRVPGDYERLFGSSVAWPDFCGLEEAKPPEKVVTLKCGNPVVMAVAKAHVQDIAEPQEQQLVTGVVLDVEVDLQRQQISPEEIFKTMIGYMLWYRHAGLQHVCDIGGDVDIVESWQVRADFMHGGEMVKAGAWMITWKVWDHRLWQAFKDGTVDGFSIGGFRMVA